MAKRKTSAVLFDDNSIANVFFIRYYQKQGFSAIFFKWYICPFLLKNGYKMAAKFSLDIPVLFETFVTACFTADIDILSDSAI